MELLKQKKAYKFDSVIFASVKVQAFPNYPTSALTQLFHELIFPVHDNTLSKH